MPHDALLAQVAQLLEKGLTLRIVIPQDTGLFRLDPQRTEDILALTREAPAVLAQVLDTFDEQPDRPLPDPVLSPQELADLAFIGRGELLEIGKGLEQAIDSGNMWKIASRGDRATTRTVRALIPIEATLRQYDGLEPIERRWFDLDDALEVRRHFVDLWLLAHRRKDQGAGPVRDRLGAVVGYIDRLRRAPIYPHMRIDDRLQIRSLQKRIHQCLEEGEGGGSEQDARRLWQDTVGFFDLLMHISRREELRDHDRLLVGKALREVRDTHPRKADRARNELRERLLTLACQEPALDALLLAPEPPPIDAYREPLEALRKRLVPA